MLIVGVACLNRGSARKSWDKHPIVVDELEVLADNQDVAVLEIPVSDPSSSERFQHSDPPRRQGADGNRISKVAVDEPDQWISRHPLHLQCRKPLAPDSNASC